jgi:hypothetical protein
MRVKRLILCLIGIGSASLCAQNCTIQTVSDYNQWGWEAIVMQNGLVTVATVPVIGARVMQYDLEDHPSIFVNPDEIGKNYTPYQGEQWRNFGGFKNWPSPQAQWNNWPPPPTLDFGAYMAQIIVQTDDSVAVFVSSPKEKWLAPNIRFERRATIYASTSRVRMEQTIINEGATSVNWGIWDITQSIVTHPGMKDYDNFWVYFPINPNSRYGKIGMYYDKNSKAWKGEVVPGIFGVQFQPDGAKILADPHKGWIAYADLSDGVVYAKTFEVFEGADYPDGGARVATYVDDNYMEVEVMSPIVELAANGGRYTFTEDWWAARVQAPVLDVNATGAIAGRLSYDTAGQSLSARYGVFIKGTARVAFLDPQRRMLAEGQPHAISPFEEFRLEETIAIPDGAKTVEVQVRDIGGELKGVLDSSDVSQLVSSVETRTTAHVSGYRLAPNYPNPFNGGTTLVFFCSKPMIGALKIYDLNGKPVATLFSGRLTAGDHRITWNPSNAASGLYVAELEIGGTRQNQKMLYIR